jgi:hypothetical protein
MIRRQAEDESASTTVADLLEQVGIVLNVFAGFLLAPQLIGLSRIRRAEQAAETTMRRLETAASARARALQADIRRPAGFWDAVEMLLLPHRSRLWISVRGMRLLLQGLLILGVPTAALAVAARLSLGWPLFAVVPAAAAISWVLLVPLFLSLGRLAPWAWSGLALPFGVVAVVGSVPMLLKYVGAHALATVAGFTVRRLEGRDRALGLMTALGVLFFVTGNACQFAATVI